MRVCPACDGKITVAGAWFCPACVTELSVPTTADASVEEWARFVADHAESPFERTLEADQVRELVGELRVWADRYPGSAEVAAGLACGLRSLPAGSVAEMRAMVAGLCALADRHPDSSRIDAAAAWEVQRLLTGEVYDLDEARRLVGVLGDLAARDYADGGDHCDDWGLAVALPCAEGLAIFTSFPDVSAEEVHTVVAQLRELSGLHPEASRLAAAVAVGLAQLALMGGLTKTGIREVIAELGRIAGLDHGEGSAEPLRIAQRLHDLSMKDFVAIGGARAAVAELGSLLDRDPNHLDIVTHWGITRLYASALYGLMNRPDATQRDVRKARRELGGLSYTHSGDPEINKIVWLLDH